MKKWFAKVTAIALCFLIMMGITTPMTQNIYATTTQVNTNANTSNTGNTTGSTTEDSTNVDWYKLKKDAKKEIKEYGEIIKLKVSEEIAKEIDKVIEKYTKAIGTADKNTKKSTDGLSTKNAIEECVSEAKEAIDALLPGSGDNSDKPGDENTTPSSTNEFIMVGGNWVTPTATYGQLVDIVLPVVNMGQGNLTNINVTPVISNLVNEWPFEIQTSGYTQTIADLPGKGSGQSDMDRRRELTWTLKTRDDALSGYYKLQFNVLYNIGTDVESATLTTYVLVKGALGSGSVETEGGGTSTPRVIVTGFTTDPAKVKAGDTFTLTLHLKNTSKRTAVSNMLVNLTAPSDGTDAESTYAAFLPTSGSNTEYISTIAKGATADLSIEMTAKADLSQKPYQIDVNMDYEDENYSSYTSTADVSIPIYQEARLELSTPEILPDAISVGNEADVMFSIYNIGKTTLYNVKVTFVGDSVSGGECFLGKIEAGGTGSVDSMVTGQKATEGDGNIKAVITYEDEAGNESKFEQDINLTVTGDQMMMDSSMYDDEEMPEIDYMESNGSSKRIVVIVLVTIAVIVIVVVVILLLKKRKRKKENAEDLELLSDIEGEDNTDEIS